MNSVLQLQQPWEGFLTLATDLMVWRRDVAVVRPGLGFGIHRYVGQIPENKIELFSGFLKWKNIRSVSSLGCLVAALTLVDNYFLSWKIVS